MGSATRNWLRRALRPDDEPPMRGDIQLAILKERLRAGDGRRPGRRLRWGLVLAPLAMIVVFFTGVGPLGGDAFDLQEVDSVLDDSRTVTNAFRREGFNVPDAFSEDDVHEFNQQLATKDGVVVGVKGHAIDGWTQWMVVYENVVNGEAVRSTRLVSDPAIRITRDVVAFMVDEWPTIEAGIEAGTIPLAGTGTMEVAGIPCTVRRWTFDTGQLGRVTYYLGEPIR
jgi:hypothetical protein